MTKSGFGRLVFSKFCALVADVIYDLMVMDSKEGKSFPTKEIPCTRGKKLPSSIKCIKIMFLSKHANQSLLVLAQFLPSTGRWEAERTLGHCLDPP